MLTIQIDGLITYSNNIKTLKLNQPIKLLPNPNNKYNKNAIGAYTLDNKKIGYIPFSINQIDITGKYKVCKINLPAKILKISKEVDESNIIFIEPLSLKINRKTSNSNKILEVELLHFSKFLKKSKVSYNNLNIIYHDNNFINLLIDDKIFYLITKKYYDDNIFKYDEFYNYNLIPQCIYEQFKIHRLEEYIYINYKSSDLIKLELVLDNIIFNTVKTNKIENFNDFDILKNAILYKISKNEYYNVNTDVDLIDETLLNTQLGGLCYNHKYKLYCHIDLYDNNNIIEITKSKFDFINLLIKLILTNKNILNIYIPTEGKIYKYILDENIKNEILKII
jgi:hypothetical protein